MAEVVLESVLRRTYRLQISDNYICIRCNMFDNALIMKMAIENIEELYLTHLDSDNVNIICKLFRKMPKLKILDVTDWNASKMTDMSNMFYNCKNLEQIIGLPTLYVSKVTSMANMFYGCESLTYIDISGWDTSNVRDMRTMFGGCLSLHTIVGIEQLNTSNLNNTTGMFISCRKLITLDLSKWNMKNVRCMSDMFKCCIMLKQVCFTQYGEIEADMHDAFFCCSDEFEIKYVTCDVRYIRVNYDGEVMCERYEGEPFKNFEEVLPEFDNKDEEDEYVNKHLKEYIIKHLDDVWNMWHDDIKFILDVDSWDDNVHRQKDDIRCKIANYFENCGVYVNNAYKAGYDDKWDDLLEYIRVLKEYDED